MEERYLGKWSESMLANYCWTFIRNHQQQTKNARSSDCDFSDLSLRRKNKRSHISKCMKSEGNYLAERLIWQPVGELSKEDMHIRYLNIGQLIESPLPTKYFNQHLGPVNISIAYNLYQDRMAFWDSLPLHENIGCAIFGGSRCLKMNIFTITTCLCLWNSVYYSVLSYR